MKLNKLITALNAIVLIGMITIVSCKKKSDSCDDIICLNGGSCSDGNCNCTEMYTGPNCGEQAVPEKIQITKIELLGFPIVDGNYQKWDPDGDADIYFVIKHNNDVIFTQPDYFEDANEFSNYTHTPNPVIDLDEPTDEYRIVLYDYDGPGDSPAVCSFGFIPYSVTGGFPTNIFINNATWAQDFILEMQIQYVW